MGVQHSLPLAACLESSVRGKWHASNLFTDHFLIMHKKQAVIEAYRSPCMQDKHVVLT